MKNNPELREQLSTIYKKRYGEPIYPPYLYELEALIKKRILVGQIEELKAIITGVDGNSGYASAVYIDERIAELNAEERRLEL